MKTNYHHILFLCVANSARSQMAEGIARSIFPRSVRVSSAGSQPGSLNPFAVAALKEIDIDISSHFSKGLNEIDCASVDLVITLCAEEVCPTFVHKVQKIHCPLPDPAGIEGSDEQKLARFRDVRNQLIQRLREL